MSSYTEATGGVQPKFGQLRYDDHQPENLFENNICPAPTADQDKHLILKRCFCGHYSEASDELSSNAADDSGKKRGRCRLCRSRAKYIKSFPSSLDTSRLFRRRFRNKKNDEDDDVATPSMQLLYPESARRCNSEDRQRSNSNFCNDNSEETAQHENSHASLFTSPGFEFLRLSRRKPSFLRRQDRLDSGSTSPPPPPAPAPFRAGSYRDHGLRTPPAPPSCRAESSFHLSHQMADELPQYLTPPPRTADLIRAYSDPSSAYEQLPQLALQPKSPPPSYEDVVTEHCSRLAPPTYEEAVKSKSERGRNPRRCETRSHSSEDAIPGRTCNARCPRAAPPPFRIGGRSSFLSRSHRTEEIPDVYWEQAARELDFCTCRKCKNRYRQYFEEDSEPSSGEMVNGTIIPMETQVLMQEVLTDGMAFCSLM